MSPAPSILRGLIDRLARRDAPARTATTAPGGARGDAARLALRDAKLGGWYQEATGSLVTGFPIGREDVVFDGGSGDEEAAEFCARHAGRVISAGPVAAAAASRIHAIDVLQRHDDPGRALADLVRVGRPGALYLLTIPDPVQEKLQRQFAPAEFFGRPGPARPAVRGLAAGDLHRIERDAFARLVTEAGLTIEARQYHGFFWAMYLALFWNCGVDLAAPAHPALDNWVATWAAVLDAPQGPRLKRLMDDFMPRRQLILARKP